MVWPAPGAPAVAESTGVFLAGTACQSLSGKGVQRGLMKQHSFSPQTPSDVLESGWRYAEKKEREVQKSTHVQEPEAPKEVIGKPPNDPEAPKETLPEKVPNNPEKVELPEPNELFPPQETPLPPASEVPEAPDVPALPKDAQASAGDGETDPGSEGSDDEVPVGYSPSTQRSGSKVVPNKFDKYYHKNFNCNQLKKKIYIKKKYIYE